MDLHFAITIDEKTWPPQNSVFAFALTELADSLHAQLIRTAMTYRVSVAVNKLNGYFYVSAFADLFSKHAPDRLLFERSVAKRALLADWVHAAHDLIHDLKSKIAVEVSEYLSRPVQPIIADRKRVLFPPGPGALLIHEVLGHLMEARSGSVFDGCIGEQIGPSFLTLIDDPTLPNAFGSFDADDEARPAQPKTLVQNGIIETFLADQKQSERDLRLKPGNARRASTAHAVTPRMSNTFLEGTTGVSVSSLQDEAEVQIIRFGPGRVDHTTGRFELIVREALHRPEGRELFATGPFLIRGHAREILQQLRGAAGDVSMYASYCHGTSGILPVSYGQPFLFADEVQCLPLKSLTVWRQPA